MIRRCTTCVHFRAYKPLSQLIVRELGGRAELEQQVLSELMKMMQDERRTQSEEASLKVKLADAENEDWCWRPMMSDYCGLHENEGRHLLHELKNRGGRCTDYDQGTPGGARCATCEHQRVPQGRQSDLIQLKRLGAMARDDALLGTSGAPRPAEFRQAAAVRMGFEAANAFYSGKITHETPRYLPFCAQYSAQDDYTVCAVHNPHDVCVGWSPRASAERHAAHPSPRTGDRDGTLKQALADVYRPKEST